MHRVWTVVLTMMTCMQHLHGDGEKYSVISGKKVPLQAVATEVYCMMLLHA